MMMTGAKLRRVDEQFRSLIDKISDAIVVTAGDGTVRFVNPAAEALFNRREDDLVGQNLGLPTIDGDVAEVEVLRNGQPRAIAELRVVEADWKGESGFLLSLRDITLQREAAAERERHQQELARSEQAFRDQSRVLQLILDSMGDGVLVCDAQGHFLMINPAARRLVGQLPNDLPREDWARVVGLFTPDGKPLPTGDTPLIRALRGEATDEVELIVRNVMNPEGRLIRESARPIRDANGELYGAVALLRDYTERKRAEHALAEKEEQLRQAQKMEAIGQLAGGVAHDFNNLLNVISGSCELLLASSLEQDPRREQLSTVAQCATTAADLVRQLLAFSRRDSRPPGLLDVNVALADLSRMLPRMVRESIAVTTELCDEELIVRASPGEIDQVVMNLVVNARDAMPSGGRLLLRLDAVNLDDRRAAELGVSSAGPYVRLSVIDDGIGMSAQVLARAFEPYFSTKERGKGTGLGLAVVYGVVRRHGGHVHIESAPERGTRVDIYWPRELTEYAPKAPDAPAAIARGSETILLVEDFDHLRLMTRGFLESQGYTVLQAANGEQGLEVFRQARRDGRAIDLLLTDVIMPGMSGVQLANEILAIQRSTKVLYASGYTGDLLTTYGVSEREAELIEKPFGFETLARKIREVLQRNANRDVA